MVCEDCFPKPGEGLKQTLEPCQSLEEAPSCSKTVLHVRNTLLTDKKAVNEFAQLYWRESILPLTPKKVGDMKEKFKQEENIPSPCLNNTLKTSELNSDIRNLKPKKALGPDDASIDILKHLGPITRKMLLEIFNRSWNTGLAPEVWKTANLVPVLKKGKDKTNPGSYRPIGLVALGISWNASSPVVSPCFWRPTTY